MCLRPHGAPRHQKGNSRRQHHAPPAIPLPWLPANRLLRPHPQQPPGALAHHLGSDPTDSHPPASHPKGCHLVHLRLGFDQKHLRAVFHRRRHRNLLYLPPPFGKITSSGNVTQPIQWSSEYRDSELGMVYYNYRYYMPMKGRWINRDFLVWLPLKKKLIKKHTTMQ
ncbi:MAG: hypothetical protein E7034_03455 [Akkermansiaceae bacterium]|nr:hypothetical protein [Akkermansiaceae bacterium]